MSFLQKPRVLGLTARFLAEGAAFTSAAPGTAAVDDKPDRSEATLINFGELDGISIDPKSEEHKIFGVDTSTGMITLANVVETKGELELTIKLQEAGALALELALRTGALTQASTTMTPNAAKTKRGWLFLDFYDEDGAFCGLDMWVRIKANSALDTSAGPAGPEVLIQLLRSALNAGTIESAS